MPRRFADFLQSTLACFNPTGRASGATSTLPTLPTHVIMRILSIDIERQLDAHEQIRPLDHELCWWFRGGRRTRAAFSKFNPVARMLEIALVCKDSKRLVSRQVAQRIDDVRAQNRRFQRECESRLKNEEQPAFQRLRELQAFMREVRADLGYSHETQKRRFSMMTCLERIKL
ncbi:MAG: hypothetical protein Q9159_001396 [Coniocarpon cinnabarinum]